RELVDTDERPVRRGQYIKQHGCLRAKFVVSGDPGLEDAFRRGLFARPGVYDAWIRFSSSSQHDDHQPDAHGMAIKLMGVDGEEVLGCEDPKTQDFLMVDSPVFFLRNAIGYGKFSPALLKARGKEPSRLYRSLRFFFSGKRLELATMALIFFIPW